MDMEHMWLKFEVEIIHIERRRGSRRSVVVDGNFLVRAAGYADEVLGSIQNEVYFFEGSGWYRWNERCKGYVPLVNLQ